MELLAGQDGPRRAGVEQRRQGGGGVDDDHWPARPASKSATIMAVPTPRSGREPSSIGLSARRDNSASSLTATAPTETPSWTAISSSRRTTSSGTSRRYKVPLSQGTKTWPGRWAAPTGPVGP